MEKFEFQTEVNELLNLMIHSLYSNKEIFLRELISNASDALDKINYLALTDEKYKNLTYSPKISLKIDKEAKTLSIKDSGIGMNKEDLIKNLGTIAKSGTKNFINELSGDAKKDSNLIGQFGVGFYSAFMVADKVEVISKKALEEQAYKWTSDTKSFEIVEAEKEDFGTEIILHITEEEFLDSYRIEEIIKKYSNHIPYAIFMDKEVQKEGEGEEPEFEIKEEQINRASALWRLSKSDLKAEDYNEFYKQISHDSNEPLFHIHTKAEGSLEYTTLFYCPSVEPFDLFRADYKSGVKLYVKRVFITDDEKELLPIYLRFIRGIIDVEDLPLNVSRELLQDNKIMRAVKEQSEKKILSELKKLQKNDKEKYLKFYNLFGKVLKEGLYGFGGKKEELLDLVMFKTSKSEEKITLKEYKERMQEGQKAIYYLSGNSYKMLINSPLLETFKAKNIEVLICEDEIDTLIFPMLFDYDKTPIQAASAYQGEDSKEEEKAEDKKEEKNEITVKIQEALKDEVKDVKISKRLTSSVACLVFDKNDADFAMQNIFKQMGQEIPKAKPILEINTEHEIIKKLENNETMINDIAKLILDMARLNEGENIEDVAEFNRILTKVIEKAL